VTSEHRSAVYFLVDTLCPYFVAPGDSRFLASLGMTNGVREMTNGARGMTIGLWEMTIWWSVERCDLLDSQLYDRRAPAAFVLRRLSNGFDVRMFLQVQT
jgi:hypothetical protein